MAQTFQLVRSPALVGSSLKTSSGAVLSFDATLTETGKDALEVTKHPVEEGIDITDHSRFQPATLSLSCVFSNSPMMGQGEEEVDRDVRLYEDLRAIWAVREPITVITSLRIWESMILKTITATRDPGGGQAVALALELEEIRFASTAVVSVPAGELEGEDTKRRGSGKRKAGRQAGDDKGSATDAKDGKSKDADATKAENPPADQPSGSALNQMFG